MMALSGCGNNYHQGPVSDHFDGKKFFNPWDPMPDRFIDFLKWRLTADRGPWPEKVEVIQSKPPEHVLGTDLRVTYVGHATVLIQTEELNILTDPIWSERASPFSSFGPKRVSKPGVAFEDLPDIDVILVSHNHYDHLDIESLKLLHQKFSPLVITPLGNDSIIHKEIPSMGIKALDWGESISLSTSLSVTLEPMQHWSARGISDRNEALWGAFVVTGAGAPIYFLADAGYAKHLSEHIINKYGPPRLSILPIGAYEPEWFMGYAHVTPAQAVETLKDLGGGFAMATQHEVFPMADEAYSAPREDLDRALIDHGFDRQSFIVPRVGEWFFVPERHPN
jgi:L-ascorbate metabolism protein UlaG (beta-lactamase superfamily)